MRRVLSSGDISNKTPGIQLPGYPKQTQKAENLHVSKNSAWILRGLLTFWCPPN